MPVWASILILLAVVAAVGFLSAAAGVVAGIDWNERRRVRSLRRTRANITAAMNREQR